jgi:hypothetical protein
MNKSILTQYRSTVRLETDLAPFGNNNLARELPQVTTQQKSGRMSEDNKSSAPTAGGPLKKKWNHHKKCHGNKLPVVRPAKFQGGKEELGGNYFDCTGYGQSDRFMKTVQKIADHIGQEYKGGGINRTEVMTQAAVIIQAPIRPVGVAMTSDSGLTTSVLPPDALDISNYQSAKKIMDYQVQNQLQNRQKVLSLTWQQRTESMHAKIKAHREYQVIEEELNGIELLRVITLICFNIEDEKYAPQKVHETKASFYALKQGRDSDQAYQITFMNTVQVIEQCGASLGEDTLTRSIVCKHLGFRANTTIATEVAKITKKVRKYTRGTAIILRADPDHYISMIRGLKKASLAGREEWPKTVTEAYNYLSKWEGNDYSARTAREFEGVAFTKDTREPQPDRREPQAWHAKMTCHKCLKVGHIATFCENEKVSHTNVQDGETQVTNEDAVLELIVAEHEGANEDYYDELFLIEEQEHRSASFHTKDCINGGRIPKEWILLDSQSKNDALSNPSLLKNINEVQGILTIHTQAGKAITKLKGTVPKYGEVWYCPDGIANILSLAHVAKTRLVRFDITNRNQLEVTKDDGSTRIFNQSEHGLYYYDMKLSREST